MKDIYIITKEKISLSNLQNELEAFKIKNISTENCISYGKGSKFIILPLENLKVIRDDGYLEFSEEIIRELHIKDWFFNDLEYHDYNSAFLIISIIHKKYPEAIFLDGNEEIINIK